jgi:hypothetical protein
MSDFTKAQDQMRAARSAVQGAQSMLDRTRRAAALQAAQAQMAQAVKGFGQFLDPRSNVANWSSADPIALLPVRVETRFASSQSTPPVHELYVRVYPDDCWIDTFEPNLSSSELDNAKRYWQSLWRAGGFEADQRAAWRTLATAHGAGRAGFIVDTYRPVNLADQPVKANPTDIILVVPTQAVLSAVEAAAVQSYWKAAWLANGNAARTGAALTALESAVGVTRAAELVSHYVPFNLGDAPTSPFTREDVALSVAFVIYPPDPPAAAQSWTQAPRVQNFPDCFVVLGFTGGVQTLSAVGGPVTLPLYVGPDPEADPTEAIHPDPATGDLFVPDPLRWMVDFQAAVNAGMGLKIALTAQQAQNGFDRLFVLGLQLSASAADGQLALTELLQHHASGRSGLSLIAQGTPAHNTTGNGSGYGRLEDPDASFDDRRNAPLFTPTADPLKKRDGQCLAEALGVAASVFQAVHGADGLDQAQAHAMQRALWPATVGYWMDKLLAPAFSDETVASTRWYLANFVSGRGAVPPIRIGGQPYGILPTTAFSRIGWLGERKPSAGITFGQQLFLTQLYELLRRVDADWTAMSASASFVGKGGDAQQLLLDIVGLHPDSAEFYSRYAETLDQLYNTVNLAGLGSAFLQVIRAQRQLVAAAGLLSRLGYTGAQPPDILNQLFDSAASLVGPIVDDVPSSETTGVRSYTNDGRNYLHWLLDAARTSLDGLRAEQGFSGNTTPRALLYLYLRQALMLGYFDTSYELHKNAGFLSPAELAAMKPEAVFVHVDPAVTQSESRFAALYKLESRITGSATELVSDYITRNYATLAPAAAFADQLTSLAVLADAPTAALERLFAEHVDICSYRFDSWLLGLPHLQLAAMRAPDDKEQSRTGVYLGAYAWLEDVRPSKSVLTPVQLPADLTTAFPGEAPLMQDADNGGYIHAPSIPHARTAAVLRSGYLANASPQNPKTMSVNLSSDRVRLALSILEGIRNGQSLGALLGYRFERGLHDDHGLAEVDSFIYPLRLAFPLVAGAIASTPIPPDTPIEAVEARNVIDGRKLVEHIRSSGQPNYPFGLTGLPSASAAQATALSYEANRLLDAYDSLADLALAEGVHQAVQGNFDRVGATLDTYSTGNFPPEPQVVQTPLGGIGLTQRVAVHFRPGLPAPANATPRATAEPALDDWLVAVLPNLATVACTVAWSDPISQAPRSRVVHLADLGLRPIDVLTLVRPDTLPAMTELDGRVWSFVLATDAPRPDAVLAIQYANAPTGTISVFAVSALVRSLSALLARSRPLQASDTVLRADADSQINTDATLSRSRIAAPLITLQAVGTDASSLITTLAGLLPDPLPSPIPPAVLNPLLAQLDALLDSGAALLSRAARFGLPQAGWGFLLGWKRDAFGALISAVKELVARWDAKRADYDTRLAAYNALPFATTDADRFTALQALEITISTALTRLPPTPAALLAAIQTKAAAFATRRDQFNAVVSTANPSFASLLGSVQALLPYSDFDTTPLDLGPFVSRAVVILQDLLRVLRGQQTAIGARITAAQAALDDNDSAAATADQVAALQRAAKALLGEEFTLYPEFALQSGQAAEWSSAYGASTGGALFDYLTHSAGVDFPVEEWLTGVARVRPALHAWEAVANLTSAFGISPPTLAPIQLPFEANAPWVALQFPSSYALASDRLLYTAQYPAGGFVGAQNQCGMLLDEWSEQVPMREQGADALYRNTGIAFNYDRPNSEAPQSILLVTPASNAAQWQWADLVAALNETLDLAKKRAVEPAQVDPTPYSSFLPATVMAATLYGISISTSLAAANGVFAQIRTQS